MEKTLKKLCEIDAVSSCEENLKKEIINLIPKNCEFFEDNLGNLIVKKNGTSNRKKIIITANLDEEGLIATKINEDNTYSFLPIGELETDSIIGSVVHFKKDIYGVINSKPIHLQTKKEKEKKTKIEDLFIDFGFERKKEAESLIPIGSIFSFKNGFEKILKNYYKAKAIGNRFCCLCLIEILKNEVNFNVVCVFVAKEKVVSNSSKTAAYQINPDFAIILKPNILKNNEIMKEQKKSVIAPIYDGHFRYSEKLLNLAKKIAEKNKISFEEIVFNKKIQTSKIIASSKKGVETVLFSLPCKKYLTTEVLNLADMKNFLKFNLEFILELNKNH